MALKKYCMAGFKREESFPDSETFLEFFCIHGTRIYEGFKKNLNFDFGLAHLRTDG